MRTLVGIISLVPIDFDRRPNVFQLAHMIDPSGLSLIATFDFPEGKALIVHYVHST